MTVSQTQEAEQHVQMAEQSLRSALLGKANYRTTVLSVHSQWTAACNNVYNRK